jgi:hypothetical protein
MQTLVCESVGAHGPAALNLGTQVAMPSRRISSHIVALRRALSTSSLHPVAYCELAQEARITEDK